MAVDWRVQIYQSINSTQDVVLEALDSDEPEGFVVQTLSQTTGRGRHGNQWSGPIGNLYMTLLLRPDCDIARAGEMAFVVAVALSKALDDYIDTDKHIKTLKWPNDILINKLKLSGILLESSVKGNKLNGLAVGVGLNIFKAPELAIGLEQVSDIPVYINKVRDNILDKLSYYYEFWQKKGFAPIREAWLNQAHGLNEEMTARLPTASFKGVFGGIDEVGSLILEMDDEEKTIHAADVHFGSK